MTRPPESEEESVDEENDVYEVLDEVTTDEGLVSASEAMDTLDPDEVLLLEEPSEESDEDADGLSRRRTTNNPKKYVLFARKRRTRNVSSW